MTIGLMNERPVCAAAALATVVACAVSAPGQVTAIDSEDIPAAAKVLERFVEATGGREAWSGVRNRVSEGRFVIPEIGLDAPITMYQGEPNRLRILIDLPEFGIVDQGTDGQVAWEVSPAAGRRLEGRELADLLLRSAFRLDAELDKIYPEMETTGVEQVGGRPCAVLRLAEPGGHSAVRYFDLESGLLVKETAVLRRAIGEVTLETTFEDYRDADGLIIYHRMTQVTAGQKMVVTFDSIRHDEDLPEDAFSVPEVIVAMADRRGPQPEQVRWLQAGAVPLRAVEAGHGFEDLQPLREMIGDARIVALGESTHGSREIFQMKHRLVEYLATELGFEIFAIEANMPESQRVGDYVLGGAGDPSSLIGGMYFWTWKTEEVLEMVQWMRRFNEDVREDGRRIEFTGFDMQFPDVALQIVRQFAADADPALRELMARLPQSLVGVRGPRPAFGTCTGTFPIDAAAGRTIKFSGWIRTEGVDGWAGLWWRADAGQQMAVAFDNMQARAPSGDTPWKRYEIELDLPLDTTNINFGMLLSGGGVAWFDDLEVIINGEPFDPAGRFDFDFDGDGHLGFGQGNPDYGSAVDRRNAHDGPGSLRLVRVAAAVVPPAPAADHGASMETVRKVLDHLDEQRPQYVKERPAREVDWIIQNARILRQYLDMVSGNMMAHRDRSMAENVRWILEQNPGSRIVLWAHNGHIAMNQPWMGFHLEQWYGDDYVPIGFSTSTGRYTAVGEGGLWQHDLAEPPPTSIESFFRQAGLPVALLDLRRADAGDPASAWLTEPRPFRSIGAMAMESQFTDMTVADRFELLIHIERTSPAEQLSSRPGAR